jgi:hypothetical protein
MKIRLKNPTSSRYIENRIKNPLVPGMEKIK